METEINAFSVALFELANEEKCVEVFEKDSQHTKNVFNKHPELLNLFKSYFVTIEEKNDVLDKIFKKDVSPLFLNFLKVLNAKQLLQIICQIIDKFIAEVNLAKNIMTGVVYSTQPIKKNEIKKLQDFINKKINRKTILTNEIDSTLISGIKIQVGDYVFQDNIKNQLEQVKNAVFKEGK